MAEFKGIVWVTQEELHGITAEDIFINEGRGRGVLETGQAPEFKDKVRQFEKLISSNIPISLGGVDKDGRLASEVMTSRDLKCRYDTHRFHGKDHRTLNVYVGPTSWQEWKQDYNRSAEEAEQLQQFGCRGEMNPFYGLGYYFSCGLGATVLMLTREGDIVVGIRKSDSYDGLVHGAAGWMNFQENVKKIHPENDARRELEEELGLTQSMIHYLSLVGLVGQPKTLESDFVYVAYSALEREYFTSGAWRDAVDACEHKDLILLNSPGQIQRLLDEGMIEGHEKKYETYTSTRYGLDVMLKNWEKFHK